MASFKAFLFAAFCSGIASAAHDANQSAPSLFNEKYVPGWLNNIGIATVRTAFPDAQRLYVNTASGEGGVPILGSDGMPVNTTTVQKHTVSAVALAASTTAVSCISEACMSGSLCSSCCPA